jgi:DNA repair exonuclease SbcCD ATPase subunit
VLKKPSELFKKKEESGQSFDTKSPAYQSFKENVQKINSLSNFNETIDSYRKNIDNVNILSEEIADIRNDIKNLLTTEDLDRALMGQFVVIDETIAGVQDKVKTINEKKLRDIRDNVREVTESVSEFLEVEAPKYKKLFFDHERAVDRKYNQFEDHINGAFNNAVDAIAKELEGIFEQVTTSVDEQIAGINQEHLASIIEDVNELGKTQEGKYKKLIVDGEIRIDERYHRFEKDINTRCEDLTTIIGGLTEQVSSVEGGNADIVKTLDEKLSDLAEIKESFADVRDAFGEQQTQIEEYVKTVSEDVGSLKADIARSEKHIKDQEKRVVEYGGFKEEIEGKVDGLNETIDKQTSSNDELRESIKQYQENLDAELKQVVERVGDQQSYNENYQERLDNRVKFQEETAEEFKQELDEALTGHQQEVNKKLKSLKKEFRLNEELVKDAITKLDIDGVEQRNYELSAKIKYLEEVFEKFSEKAILTESIVTEPPSTNNEDPLTPLDQDFVTLDQLNDHYRKFLVRIQQQLSTLGGGGEVRLEFLDDIDRSTAKVDGKFLKYEASSGKWVGATGGGGADTETVRDAIQGYYGYTTDFYTVGVANTTQEIGAGVTTMIEPQVASDGINQYLPTVMTGVGTNPYIGNTATTVGTGQTQFSLAGLSSGASCIVRTALAFDPDIDNTNLDVQLKFTTNTATQGTGLTNFTIKKEQALIMNEGADQQYISENIFSFFVGTTLEGTTYSNAGSFNVEVIPSAEGILEVLAVTVNVVT